MHIKRQPFSSLPGKASDSRPVWGRREHRDGERVWCVQVDTGAIVTRRNGKVAVVGNCQVFGRGTRPIGGTVDFEGSTAESRKAAIADSAKPTWKFTDLRDSSMKHQCQTPADVLAGSDVTAEQLERARKMLQEKGFEETDVAEILEEAKQQVEEEEAKEAARLAQVRAEAEFHSVEVDPLNGEFVGGATINYQAEKKMPFGKYKDVPIEKVPSGYLHWLTRNHPPTGWLKTEIQHRMKVARAQKALKKMRAEEKARKTRRAAKLAKKANDKAAAKTADLFR